MLRPLALIMIVPLDLRRVEMSTRAVGPRPSTQSACRHLPIRLILLHFAILGTRNRQVITRIRPRTQHPITAFCRSCPSPLYRRQCAELAITRPITSLLRPRKAMGVTSEVPRRSIMRDHPRAAPSLERGGRGAGHWRRAVVLATGLARAAHLPRLAAGIRHRLLLYASDQIKSCRS
jgi:hypothetical protein